MKQGQASLCWLRGLDTGEMRSERTNRMPRCREMQRSTRAVIPGRQALCHALFSHFPADNLVECPSQRTRENGGSPFTFR